MKVLHVIDTLGRGGAEQLLATLLPELRQQGVDSVIAVRGGAMDLVHPIKAAGIQVHRLKPRHRWHLPGMAREIAKIARAEGVQIVHAHLYFPAVSTALMRVLSLSQVRTCVTFHNLAYSGANRAGLGLTVKRRFAGWLYPRGIDRCFGVSAAVADHYRTALRLPRVDVIHNSVDTRKLMAVGASRPRTEARGSACQIVLPGRIAVEKGHTDLIEALSLLRDSGLCPHLTIAGDGPSRDLIAELVHRLELDDQVTFTGPQDHDRLMRIVAAADIVTIPSRFEGFGLTALEAMALGRTVVASSAGGLPEILGDCGVLVPPADPAALAGTIEALTEDVVRRVALGTAAAWRAEQLFALPNGAARLITAYRELLSSCSQL